MLKKIKDWIGTNLDVYKVETANDVGAGLVRHIWKGEETATQVGTTLSAQIMNDLQKGLVHTLDTIRTVGTNKDIYEVALTGIEEFGVFDGLKLLIRIDGENQFEDVFLKLGGTEYQIYQLKNNTFEKIDKGILKDKKEYLLNFKNNSFILSDSTLYGSQKGTALEGNRLAEILGLQFGGNIQDIGNKTKGKFYYDSITKFYYECIEDNSLTYNDSGKFRAISNKPISDKLENLYEAYSFDIGNNVPIAQVFETKIKVPSKPFKFFYSVVTGSNYLVDLNKAYKYASSEININFGVSQKGFLQYSIAKNSSPVDGRTIYVMFIF
ncbi:Uncharacterised protein [uncultured Leptotrichia sp.]|uniref:hypothetical protein n=1 Tax=uncultured Leptotrichia sp. TaxID=159271 RepID=UPI001A5A3670|nr:hypothetical protein [uncultured Leptotrichia sp.]VTX50725.1 Uncharacterised protein [uncultured Leptotrichia sp.]